LSPDLLLRANEADVNTLASLVLDKIEQ
jgi:hypothetical protein